jgi:hypothetical protein
MPQKLRRPSKWSGRGIQVLDFIETSQSTNDIFKPIKTKRLSPNQKLNSLLAKFPANPFYQSLARQIKSGSLSPKQEQCIGKDFFRHFG